MTPAKGYHVVSIPIASNMIPAQNNAAGSTDFAAIRAASAATNNSGYASVISPPIAMHMSAPGKRISIRSHFQTHHVNRIPIYIRLHNNAISKIPNTTIWNMSVSPPSFFLFSYF